MLGVIEFEDSSLPWSICKHIIRTCNLKPAQAMKTNKRDKENSILSFM
jgi:hypothetical protein